MNLQAATSKLKTGCCKLGNNGVWVAVSADMIEQLGIEEDVLLKLDFVVTVDKNKIVIESLLLDKEQRPSNASTPGKAGTNQRVD